MNWEAVKEIWPFIFVVAGHVIRTEKQRAVLTEKIEVTQTAQEEAVRVAEKSKDEVLAALKSSMDETREMHREMRGDIKHLLERK